MVKHLLFLIGMERTPIRVRNIVHLVIFLFYENINNSTRIWIYSVQLSSVFCSLSFNLWPLYAHDTIPKTWFFKNFPLAFACPFLPVEWLGVSCLQNFRESSPVFLGVTKEVAAFCSDLNTSYRVNPELPLKQIWMQSKSTKKLDWLSSFFFFFSYFLCFYFKYTINPF